MNPEVKTIALLPLLEPDDPRNDPTPSIPNRNIPPDPNSIPGNPARPNDPAETDFLPRQGGNGGNLSEGGNGGNFSTKGVEMMPGAPVSFLKQRDVSKTLARPAVSKVLRAA